MTQPDPSISIGIPIDTPTTVDVLETIIGFLLPFFLGAVNGNLHRARAAIAEMIGAYGASTPTELDLVGRIVGFSIVAMDNLRLSMTDGMSDTKILRYRCNAVTLGRASDRARKLLETLQSKPGSTGEVPRPAIAAAPVAPAPAPAAAPLQAAAAAAPPGEQHAPIAPRAAVHVTGGGVSKGDTIDIETSKHDARIRMQAFSKQGAQVNPSAAQPPHHVLAGFGPEFGPETPALKPPTASPANPGLPLIAAAGSIPLLEPGDLISLIQGSAPLSRSFMPLIPDPNAAARAAVAAAIASSAR